MVRLRHVTEADLPELFRQQADAESSALAAVVPREREAYAAHMEKVLADPAAVYRIVDVDGALAGSALSFERDGRRWVGYWLDRPFWGRGIATTVLGLLLDEPLVAARPLWAEVATHNPASRRVLEKHGFEVVSEDERDGVSLWLLRLDGDTSADG